MIQVRLFVCLLFLLGVTLVGYALEKEIEVKRDVCYGEAVNDRRVRQTLLMDMYQTSGTKGRGKSGKSVVSVFFRS